MAAQSTFGLNTSFAIKRWPEPERWAALVRDLAIQQVQFSFDLLDPTWPAALTSRQAGRIRHACETHELHLDSAFLGLAAYSYNGLLHPERDVRSATERWWTDAASLAAEMGAQAMGGPLGGVSVTTPLTQDLQAEVIERLHRLAEHARSAGLAALLIEPTPLVREWPHTPDNLATLLRQTEHAALPVQVVLDLGHVYFHPLYGQQAALRPWLHATGPRLHGLHLQQTDGQADRHWNFTQPGLIDLPAVREELTHAGLADRPAVLEVFYPFELDDHQVWQDVRDGVSIARAAWDAAPPGAEYA